MSCSAVNCFTRKSQRPELLFFRFPLDAELRRKWVVAMRREKMKGEDKPWEPSKHTRLCSLHFRPEDIDHSRIYRKLNRNAIPSIFSWPDKNQNTMVPSQPEESAPIVNVNAVPKRRRRKSRKKVCPKRDEETSVSEDEHEYSDEVLRVDLNDVPLRERLQQIEKIVDKIYVPHNQHIDSPEEIEDIFMPSTRVIDVKEEIIEDIMPPYPDVKEEVIEDIMPPYTDIKEEVIEDVFAPQNQLVDVKEEVTEDIYMPQNLVTNVEEVYEDVRGPQNQPNDLKEEIIEDVYVPQSMDLKEEIIEDVYAPQSMDLKEEIIEDVMPPNHSADLDEEIIETICLPQNERVDLTDLIIEEVYVPQNQQINLAEEIIEYVLVPQKERTDSTEELCEDLFMPQNERVCSRLKAHLEIDEKKPEHIGRLRNLVSENRVDILRKSQKLKRLNSSKPYFQLKLSAMNKLLEELNEFSPEDEV